MGYIGQTPTAVPLDGDDITDGIISEAKLAADAVSLAKMKAGTDGNIISYDASGNPVAVATGTDGQVLTSTGAGSPPAFEAAAGITQGTTVATTSGNSITFGSIPAGVKRIVIILSSVSTASTSPMVIRLGDAGGIETTGYLGAVTNGTTNYTYGTGSGIALQTVSAAAAVYHFTILLSLLDADTFLWNASHTGAVSDTYNGAGTKALSAELTQVQLTTVAGNQAFDSGKMNIQYE